MIIPNKNVAKSEISFTAPYNDLEKVETKKSNNMKILEDNTLKERKQENRNTAIVSFPRFT